MSNAAFQSPDAVYRPAPLWVWNDRMTRDEISCHLHQLKEHGFGGAFVHPRPGLMTEYLSDEWFELWGYALQIAKELGLLLSIYDENSYPSGFAGGKVPAQLPDCLAEGMTYRIFDLAHDTVADNVQMGLPTETPIAAFSCRVTEDGIEVLEDISVYTVREWPQLAEQVFAVFRIKSATNDWLAGFAYVDLLRPEVTQAFLESTHEAYYRRFGADFGGAIPALFTDEPNISAGSVYSKYAPALPFSYWFLNEFQKRMGYPLTPNLPCVFKDVKGSCFAYPPQKIRYDYYTMIHDLWVQNSIEPIGRWCAEHNINWTGHYPEHIWPHMKQAAAPSVQSLYEYHQWPGIDVLFSVYLRGRVSHPLAHTMQEVCSVANQLNKQRTICELYGTGGWDANFDDFKRMGDWVLVNGINLIVQHQSFTSMAGARKRDHPQSFDWREPWWQQYTVMNDYLSRACLMLSQGRMEQRILLLNPSTTGYLTPYEEERGDIHGDYPPRSPWNPEMNNFIELRQLLSDRQWDVDLGDEYILARHAHAEDGGFVVGQQRYGAIVLSGDMQNAKTSTMQLLTEALVHGVPVISVGHAGPYVDGLAQPQAWQQLEAGMRLVDADEIDGCLVALLGRRLNAVPRFLDGMAHHRRVLDDGREVWFFVNHAFDPYVGLVTVHGSCAVNYDLFSGEITGIPCEQQGDAITFHLTLAHNQSCMVVVGEEAPIHHVVQAAQPVALQLQSIEQECDNLLPLCYCDLTLDGRTLTDVSVLRAADRIFCERGFSDNPWDNRVQHRTATLDRNSRYGEGSGFRADYHLTIAPGTALDGLRIIAEQPELCRLEINGQPAPWTDDCPEFGPHFGKAAVGHLLREGSNVISVIVDRFDVRMELEAIYVQGCFDVRAENHVWQLAPATPVSYGSWRQQGKPFYPYAMLYHYTCQLDRAPAAALLDVQDYEALAVSAIINGHEVLLHGNGCIASQVAQYLHAGSNSITVRVCGSLRNVLGPFFTPEPVRGSVWPGMWKKAPTHQPPAEGYDLMDFGLTIPLVLMVD